MLLEAVGRLGLIDVGLLRGVLWRLLSGFNQGKALISVSCAMSVMRRYQDWGSMEDARMDLLRGWSVQDGLLWMDDTMLCSVSFLVEWRQPQHLTYLVP